MSTRKPFIVGESPDTASKVIVAVARGIATVVGRTRDRSVDPAPGQIIMTHRAAMGALSAYHRGTSPDSPEPFLSVGATFPASILKDSRYKSGVVASWSAMNDKEAAQREARAAAATAVKFLQLVKKSGLVL